MNELQRLEALMDAGHVRLGVHIRRMNSPGSPVYHSGENIWPAALVLLVSLAALKWGGAPLEALGVSQAGPWAGIIALAAGCWWWFYKVMPRVRDGVFNRTAAFALQSPEHFDALWAKGVLTLYAKLPDGTERVALRKDSWREYTATIEGLLRDAG